jgi:hypothetical protein
MFHFYFYRYDVVINAFIYCIGGIRVGVEVRVGVRVGAVGRVEMGVVGRVDVGIRVRVRVRSKIREPF